MATWRARSLSLRLCSRAWRRSRVKASVMSTRPRWASMPLDCSMMTRLFSAVCRCSVRVSARCRSRSSRRRRGPALARGPRPRASPPGCGTGSTPRSSPGAAASARRAPRRRRPDRRTAATGWPAQHQRSALGGDERLGALAATQRPRGHPVERQHPDTDRAELQREREHRPRPGLHCGGGEHRPAGLAGRDLQVRHHHRAPGGESLDVRAFTQGQVQLLDPDADVAARPARAPPPQRPASPRSRPRSPAGPARRPGRSGPAHQPHRAARLRRRPSVTVRRCPGGRSWATR